MSHYIRIRSRNSSGYSTWSSVISFDTATYSSGGVCVRLRARNSSGYSAWSNVVSFSVSDYNNGTRHIRVRSRNATGYSPWSNAVSFLPMSTPLVPPVLNTVPEFVTPETILSWLPVAGAKRYAIEIYEGETLVSTNTVTEPQYGPIGDLFHALN